MAVAGGPARVLIASIFISHANDDPHTEPVLQALVAGLKRALGPTHDAYDIAYDREIAVGRNWREEIYTWLYDCPVAIVLLSKKAVEKNWLPFEASYLSVRQIHQKELCLIPVYLDGVDIRALESLETGVFRDIQGFQYPSNKFLTVDDLVTEIADRIKKETPPRGRKNLVGLAATLCEKLSAFPESARKAAAVFLDGSGYTNDERLTELLVATDELMAARAFCDHLCENAQDESLLALKREIAHIIGALPLSEEDAKPIAVEAAKPSGAPGRALLLDSDDREIIDFYLTRAARRFPHRWDLTETPSVLEHGQLDDLDKTVRRIVAAKFGNQAGRSEDRQFKLGTDKIRYKRRLGHPVVLKLDYSAEHDPVSAFKTIRNICPELMVLYASPGAKPADHPDLCIISPHNAEYYDHLITRYSTLKDACVDTTPEKGASK
jgi:hypothetical protein